MATLEKIQAQIAKLQGQAEALVAKQSSSVIAKIRDLMNAHGLTIADIEAHIGGRKRARMPAGSKATGKSQQAAKYIDPKTGASWTGHGRAPAWIASAKDRSKYLIDVNSERPAVAAKRTVKAGNYVRGPQVPKYRDPATGVTWSGRGPAPAWLAGAKDRTAFLIADANAGTVESKVAVAKKRVAQKVATKKNTTASKQSLVKKPPVKKSAGKKAIAREVTASSEAPAETQQPGGDLPSVSSVA
jgi:DNA-binding protein H-NS